MVRRVAWVFDERGARNVWVADAPGFEGRRLTAFEGDDGTTIHSLAFSRDGRRIAFVRGDGPNRAGELPNPTSDPGGSGAGAVGHRSGRGTPPHHRAGRLPPLHRGRTFAALRAPAAASGRVSLDADAEPEQLIHGRGSFGTSAPLPRRRPARVRLLAGGAFLRRGLRLRREDRPLPRSGGGPRRLARLLARRERSGVPAHAAGARAVPVRSEPGRSPLEHPGGFRRRTRVPAGRSSVRSPEREASSRAPPPPTSSTGRMTAASSFPGSSTGYRHYYAVSATRAGSRKH